MESVDDQVKSVELSALLKAGHSANSLSSGIARCVSLLRSVSSKFSIAHVSHDLLKFIKAVIVSPAEQGHAFSDLITLLTEKFQFSFRPAARDVVELIKVSVPANATWAFGDLLSLLHSSLGYHQGNPKNSFLTVADEFVPLVKSLDITILLTHSSIIQKVLGVMFEADANMTCISAYLSSKAVAASSVAADEPPNKRRKSGQNEVYVSRLFQHLDSNFVISRLVLSEFVARRRHSRSDGSDGPELPVSEDAITDEEFAFFLELVAKAEEFGAKINLWTHMSALRIYRLRDEHSERHRAALQALLDAAPSDPTTDDLWRCLGAVVAIDPVNFTDVVTDRIFSSLATLDTHLSLAGTECMQTLLRTFAVKGSFADVAKKMCHHDVLGQVDVRAVFCGDFISSISAMDLMDSVEFLLPLSQSNEAARALALPLIDLCFHRVPENLLPRAVAVVTDSLALTVERFAALKKKERGAASAQLLVLSDAVRKIRVAYANPVSPVDTADIEQALTLVAQKDSSNRCAALLRLSLLCGVETSVADLIACDSAQEQITAFISDDHLNAFALTCKFGSDPDWKQLKPLLAAVVGANTFKAFPETLVSKSLFRKTVEKLELVVSEGESELAALLNKTEALLGQFARVAFTPVALRRAAFPAEIISVELAWANQVKAESVKQLVATVLSQTEPVRSRVAVLYGLCVVLEEARRNKIPIAKLIEGAELKEALASVDSLPLLPQVRFVLAVHGAVPELEMTETSELLAMLAQELLASDHRDRPAVDAAYFALFQALITGTDRRRVRIPWWCNKMPVIIMAIRGLIGSCISGADADTQLEAALYVARLWKTIVDSLSAEKFHRLSKSVPVLAGEYIRLSARVVNPEAAAALDKGCCALLDKLSESERQFLHAMLGKSDRETLRRLIQLLDRSFKYKGKI